MTQPGPSGAAVLDDVEAFVSRYVAFPTIHCIVAVVLWAAHTHAQPGTWYVTPRLILDSAEPGSGKTRVLELLNLLVLNPEMTISATTAAIFRMLDIEQKSLLFDEVDAIFNPKNGGNYEDLRALLNAGYKAGASIARCVGDAKAMKVQRFKVFAPVALAGLAGNMPKTITSRAVTVHMRRRGPRERVAPFRERDAEHETLPLRLRLSDWVIDVSPTLATARPKMPAGVEDRGAEVWEALLAVADAAGGHWPARARAACEHFVLEAEPGGQSLGVRLLADLRTAFTAQGVDRMPTDDVVAALLALDEAPWADLYGKPLDPRRLAKELSRYDVKPVQYRDASGKQRGYVTAPSETPRQAGLGDAWARYLPEGGTSGTAGTAQLRPVPDQEELPVQTGTAAPARTGCTGTGSETGTGLTCDVPLVPAVPQESSRWRVSGRPVA